MTTTTASRATAKRQVNFRMDEDLYEQVREAAWAEQSSVTDWLARAALRALDDPRGGFARSVVIAETAIAATITQLQNLRKTLAES